MVKLSTPALLVIAVIAIIVFIFVPVLFVIAVIIGIIYAIGYYGRKKCPSCGARGSITSVGTETVRTEKAFGLVTRTDTSMTKKRDNRGRVINEESTSQRQERVPIIRSTLRTTFRCNRCGHTYYTESVSQEEDFSREEAPASKETYVVQKEVVKVPCKYCGVLNEVTQRTCSNCGARLNA